MPLLSGFAPWFCLHRIQRFGSGEVPDENRQPLLAFPADTFARGRLMERIKSMKIAITTPTGHVGSAVADFLLDKADEVSVRLLGRRPNHLQELTERRPPSWPSALRTTPTT